MHETANLRKPEAVATRITTRTGAAANDNRGADYLPEEVRARMEHPAWVAIVDESLKAYVFGIAKLRRLQAGEARVSDAVLAIMFYVNLRDSQLDLTRAQQHFLLYWAYLGAGMKSHAERAERIYKNPFFED